MPYQNSTEIKEGGEEMETEGTTWERRRGEVREEWWIPRFPEIHKTLLSSTHARCGF